MSGAVRSARTRSRTEEKENGICNVSQGFIVVTPCLAATLRQDVKFVQITTEQGVLTLFLISSEVVVFVVALT